VSRQVVGEGMNTHDVIRRPDVRSRPAGPSDNGTDYRGEGVAYIEPYQHVDGVSAEK
jgi:hypothetical protein